MDRYEYHIDVKWTDTRKGLVTSPEVNGSIEVAIPPPFEGGIAGIWSPKHLLTASVASCFMTTFLAIATYSKLLFHAFNCKATGILAKKEREGKFQISEVVLEPTLVIMREEDRDKALRILAKSEAACFIAHSIKASVQVVPSVITLSSEL